MKLLKFIPFILIFFSCKSSPIITNTIEIDPLKDVYLSKKILKKEIDNYEINATLKFNKSYRRNGYGWAGFLLETNKLDGLHGEDQGYAFFIRLNGEVGFHSSLRGKKEFTKNKKIGKRFKLGESIDVKIRRIDSSITIYVNDKKLYEIDDFKLNGNYISSNAGGVSASIKINSFKTL